MAKQGLRQAAPAEKVQVEDKGVWSTWTLSQVFIMLQLGQDMAPCETHATENHSENTKLDQNDHFKLVKSYSQDKYSH